MAKMTIRGFLNLFNTKTYTRFNIPSEDIYYEIINELKRNNINCSTSIERAPYRFKQMESDGKALFISEKGLFTLFVTICSVGNYSQVQVVTRNIPRRYSFEDANHTMEYAMHNLYIDAVHKCIFTAIDRIATANNWIPLDYETSETENQ